MSLQVKSPHKKKRKTKSSSLPPSLTPSFSLLPNEITLNYLARIPRSYYPKLSRVSKTFHSLLSSTDLYAVRSQLGNTEQCLYVCLWDANQKVAKWFMLVNPNLTLPNSILTKKKNKKTTGQLLVPVTSSKFCSLPRSTVLVDSEIYVIGGSFKQEPSSAVRILDCRIHTWRDAPSMNVARYNPYSCGRDGKIYVLGGCEELKDEEPWAEVFNIKTQTWECLPIPSPTESKPSPKIFMIFKEIERKIYYGSPYKMYVYDIKQGRCECCENLSFDNILVYAENESYSCCHNFLECRWYDSKDKRWKKIKGLHSLRVKAKGGVGRSKLVSCGGKHLLIWEEYRRLSRNGKKKILGAEIVLEKLNGCEVWGNLKWVSVVHHTVLPKSCNLLHCLPVSV